MIATLNFKTGVEYDYWESSNGKFGLIQVPIFQETVDTRSGQKREFSRKELANIVEENRRLQFEQAHAPSIHWGHNDGKERDKLGEVINMTLGKLFGKWTIFADVADIDPQDFEDLKNGKYPHVSIELTRTLPTRIGSVAFLSSNAPYHTLPNIKVGKKVKRHQFSQNVYHYSSGDTEEFITSFTGENIMPDKFKTINTGLGSHPDPKKNPLPKGGSAFEEDEEEIQMADEAGGDLEGRVSVLESKIDMILEKLGGDEGEGPASSAEPISTEDEGQMKSGKMDIYMANKKETNNLKKRIAQLEKDSKKADIDRQAEKALRLFSEQGIIIDEDEFKKKFSHKVMNYGDAEGIEYVEEIEANYPRANTIGHFSDAGSPSNGAAPKALDPASLAKYKEEGDEEYQVAFQADQFYIQNATHFSSIGLTRGDYIEGEVANVRLKKLGLA